MPDQDVEYLLELLNATPANVKFLARDLDEASLRQRPTGDLFSFVETACHLRDLEREAYTARITRILDEDHPALDDFDGTRVAEERNYQAQDLEKALSSFEEARTDNVKLLRRLSDEQFHRTGEMEGEGSITLKRLLEMMREHDEIHQNELTALREQLTGQVLSARS